MNKRKLKKRQKNMGIFLTNPITDNITKNGEVINANKDNAVYARECSEIIRL